MQAKYADVIERIAEWSQQTEEVEGTLLIGSQARNVLQADQWSDLDLMVLVHTPETFLNESGWLNRFGKVVCAFNDITPLPFTSWNWTVKRVLLDDNRDIDFSILPYAHLDEVLMVNQGILAKGYQVLYDSHAPLLETKVGTWVAANVDSIAPPSSSELSNTINDLLFHTIWAFKKIERQELWVAVSTINQRIGNLLLRLIEWHTRLVTHRSTLIDHEGRFLEMRAAGEIINQLGNCFTPYDRVAAISTLGNLIDITFFIAQELAEAGCYTPNPEQFAMIRRLYGEMKAQANQVSA